MHTILHTPKLWWTEDGRLEVYDAILATRINKCLKTYAKGKYKFAEGEEAVFRVSPSQTDSIWCLISKKKPTISGTPGR